jgi:uncharacterized RDD family membrane protein YckC
MGTAASPPLDTIHRIELAEGVDVELRPAGPMARAVAFSIDLAIFIAAAILLQLLSFAFIGIVGAGIATGSMNIFLFLLYWGYHVAYEAGVHGATPGKRRMGLRVVSDHGGPPTLAAIILRNTVRPADFLPWGYLFTQRFQRLGDLVAHTLVVYDRRSPAADPPADPAPNPSSSEPPPVTLSREERHAIVRFLERSPTWSDARRTELANHAATLTGSNGPAGTSRLLAFGRWLRDS